MAYEVEDFEGFTPNDNTAILTAIQHDWNNALEYMTFKSTDITIKVESKTFDQSRTKPDGTKWLGVNIRLYKRGTQTSLGGPFTVLVKLA